ncbi:hypothetical protein Tco_1541276 [Tanacetum coccineum]
METEAIDNQANLVNYDNENENEIDDLGYQSEEYIEVAHEDDENNHSNGYAKRGITRISGKHRALFSSFLGDMVREHIGLQILSWKKVGPEARNKLWDEITPKIRWKLLMLNSASKETEDKIKEETLQVISGTDAMTLVLVLMRRAEQLLFGCDQNDAAFGRKCKKGSNGCTTFLDVVGGFAPHSHRISCFGSKGQHHQSTIQMITCENKTAPKVQMKRNNCLRLCDAMQRPESVHLLYDTHPPHIQYNYAALLAGVHSQARLLAEFFERRKKQLAAERAEAIRNKPPTRTQVRNRMITYLKHMGKYTHQQLKHKNFEEVQKLYEREKKWIDDFKPIDDDSQQQAESTKKRPRADSEEESSKKQKLEEDNDAEKEELRDSMDVVPRDDVAIDVESLATKYPIVDWKTHILNENMMYYQIIRADGSSKNYKIFSEMLDDFDRQDVIDLHRLVNERYETTSPEGYDLLLWGDLKTLFEPNEEDEIWKNQQDYNLISWRLFDSCGVHVLLMNTGVAIHMMIEKKYPLTQEMLSRMLNRRLEVDYESEMAFELLRFTRSQLQK